MNWILSYDHILESPFYGVLNSCRVLQMLTIGPGTVSSKEEGAIWALENLPPVHRDTISFALNCYRSDKEIPASQRQKAGLDWNEAALLKFRDFVAGEQKKHLSNRR